MSIIQYFKAEPTEFARITSGGKEKKSGTGIAGFYMPYRTTVEVVSIASTDQPFAFSEISSDKQEVNLQGGIIYRISNPEAVLAKYNFSVDPKTKAYLSEDEEKLPSYLIQEAQTNARRIIQATPLETLLLMSDDLSKQVVESVRKSGESIGVEVDMLYFSGIKPKPEISKAMEATYRENLLQQADEAMYTRRANAVEKERTIQENELYTKIQLEEKRKEFVDLEGNNELKSADFKAQAVERELAAYQKAPADMMRALALYEIGKNASRIGNLSITPDLLTAFKEGVTR